MGAKERFGGQESATGHWNPADDGWSVVVCILHICEGQNRQETIWDAGRDALQVAPRQ